MQESTRHSSLPTFERDVLVPMGHAILGGVTGAVAIALLAVCAAILGGWRWWWPLLLGAMGGAFIAAGIAGFLIIDRRKLLNELEKKTRLDIDGDGRIGGDIRIVPVRGAWEAAQHKARQDAAAFREFLRALYTGRPATWREWEDELKQEQWEKYCDRLLTANLAERKGATSPLILTSTFREALVAFVDFL